MFQVRWQRTALNQLTALWVQSGASLRQMITASAHQAEQRLRIDPLGVGESRLNGRRVLFEPPLGILYRVDGSTVSVLRIWLYRLRRP